MGVVIVKPNNPGNTHDISLSGLGRKWGIRLERGAQSIIEAPVQPSNIEKSGGVKKYGDFDPAFATIEMRTWDGGRGGEFLSDDPTKYFDGYGWSMSPGIWHQAPQWWYGEIQGPTTAASTVSAFDAADNFMPGALRSSAGYSVKWHSMASTTHLARSFLQQGSSYDMARVETWVRKIGQPPAPLNLRILTTMGSGRPASSIAANTTAQLTAASAEGLESFVWETTLTTITAQTGASDVTWWVELWTSVVGTDANHWELGYNSSLGVNSSVMSGDGTPDGWSAASTINFYFRVSPARGLRRMHFFSMDNALYAVEEKLEKSTGTRLYINGDRGIGSSGGAGTTAVLNDSSKNWVTNRWVGAKMMITAGPGIGEISDITANNSTSLSVSLINAPTSLSEYVIYDTNEWTEISTAIMDTSVGDNPVIDVTVGAPGSQQIKSIAYMAFGNTTQVGLFRWNSSVHQGDKMGGDSTDIADVLYAYQDSTGGPLLVRGVSSVAVVSYSKTTAFGELDFVGTSVRVGGSNYEFTNIIDYNGKLHVFKEDAIYIVSGTDKDQLSKINVGLDSFPSSNNGRAAVSQNLFLYTNWSHSVERMQKGTIDDIGLWRGAGLKDGHAGPVNSLVPYIAWTLGGVDAGSTGISGAYAWNGRGWHEFYRVPTSGKPIQSMYMQNNPGGHPRLWMSVGAELICQRWPKDTLNPRNDGEIHYQHEAVMETATIDMNAMQIPKLFSKTFAITKNLASSVATIHAEYQLDDNIGSTKWLSIGKFSASPVDSLQIRRGNKHAIRMRYRALTQVSTIQAELHAVVVKAVARTPVRRQWTLRAVTGDFQVDQQGLQDADPDDFYMWLQDAAVSAEPILMHSAWKAMDGIYVYAEHPTLARTYTTPDGNWGGTLQMTIREIEDD